MAVPAGVNVGQNLKPNPPRSQAVALDAKGHNRGTQTMALLLVWLNIKLKRGPYYTLI